MENTLTLNIIIKENGTIIISSKEKKSVMAVYNCKTAEQIGKAVEKYIKEEI